MKKIISLGLSILLLFSFCACKENEKQPTQTDDNTKVQNLLSVLNNKKTFINAKGESVYVKDYKPLIIDNYSEYWDMDYFLSPSEFAFIDLDNDDVEELIVHDDVNRCYFILRKENDKVYGYSLYYNMQFKADGTYRTYHGSNQHQYKTISFNKQDYSEDVFAMYYVDEDGIGGQINESTINDKAVSYDEIKKFRTEWENRPDALWRKYINENNDENSPKISIDKVRKALKIPVGRDVTYAIEEPYYDESFGKYLSQVNFYEYGQLVAGAAVSTVDSELGSNIMLYTTENLNDNSDDLYNQAIKITKDVYNREMAVFMVIHNSCDIPVDESQCIPGYPNYCLVIDERFKTLDDLKAFINACYTPECADKLYGDYFSHPDCSYKEYNGRLYSQGVSRGYIYFPYFDTLQIISQDDESLVVKYGKGLYDTNIVAFSKTLYLKKIDNIWYFDNVESVSYSEGVRYGVS